jgi:hypothetical protein
MDKWTEVILGNLMGQSLKATYSKSDTFPSLGSICEMIIVIFFVVSDPLG